MDAVLPTFFLQESFEASWPDWKRSLVKGYEIENGEFRIPTRPGLGVEVQERQVERFRSDVMDPIGPEPPWVIAGTWVDRSRGSTPKHRRRHSRRPRSA
jgi:hypothetical protein